MGLMSTLFAPRAQLPAEYSGNPVKWLQEVGGPSRMGASGIEVTTEKAMTVGAVFACVRAIAEDCAKLPTIPYRRIDDEGRERASDDPLYDLLHLEPNPEMGAFDFESALIACAVLWGNGYAEIETDGLGNVAALWPVLPFDVRMKRGEGGRLHYELRSSDDLNKWNAVSPNDIIHVKGLTFNGLMGVLIQHAGKESIGLAIAAMQYTASFFAHGATPSIALELPGKLSESALTQYMDDFTQAHAGSLQAHRPLAVDSGVKVHTLSANAEESQLLETLKFSVVEVARYFRVPPHKIMDLERATFSNIEHQSLEYVGDTLLPWLTRMDQEYTRKLISKPRRREMFIEHLVDALLRVDTTARYAAYQVAIQNGIMNRNEVRQRENLNPVPGGERYIVAKNMSVLDENGELESPEPAPTPPSLPPAPPEDDSAENEALARVKVAMRGVIQADAERIIAREANAMKTKRGDCAKWYDGHRDYLKTQLSASIFALADAAGAKAPPVLERYADLHVGESLRRLDAGEELNAGERAGWIADHLIREVCDGLS